MQRPFEHIVKCVRWIVELRVPHHVRQHPDRRLRQVHTGLFGESLGFEYGVTVEMDPVVGAVPPAIQIRDDPALHPGRPRSVQPRLDRLVHKGVMVRVPVTENKSLLSIGDVPRSDGNVTLFENGGRHTLRYVNAVVQDGCVEPFALLQTRGCSRCQLRASQVAAQHTFGVRVLELRAGIVSKRSCHRLLA